MPTEADQPISTFLERYRHGTGYTYRSGVLAFLDFIAGKRMRGFNSSTDEFEQYEKFASDYLKSDRNKARDFFLFVKSLGEKKIAPKTAHTKYISVREWLKYHDIVIPEKTKDDARRMKPKGGRRTDFEYFDKGTIREILAHGDVRFRAFVLVLASSGIRLGEALNLKWNNLTIPDRVKYPEKPGSLFIEESKTGNSRKVFISREAENALAEWRKVIPEYREHIAQKAQNFKKDCKHSPDAMFPISGSFVYKMWDQALRDAKLLNKDDRTGRTRLNIHRLRNFFAVKVSSVAGDNVSEFLLGHVDKYGHAYDGRPFSEWESAYRKAEPELTVSEIVLPSRELEELRRLNEELQARLTELEQAQETKRKIEEKELFKQVKAAVDAAVDAKLKK